MGARQRGNKTKPRTEKTTGHLFTADLARHRRRRASREGAAKHPAQTIVPRRRRRRVGPFVWTVGTLLLLVCLAAAVVYQQRELARRRAAMLEQCLQTFATGAFRTCREHCAQFRAIYKTGKDVDLVEQLSTLARDCQIVSSGRGDVANFTRACRLAQKIAFELEHGHLSSGESRSDFARKVTGRVKSALQAGVDSLVRQFDKQVDPRAVELLRQLKGAADEAPLLAEVLPENLEETFARAAREQRLRDLLRKAENLLVKLEQTATRETIYGCLELLSELEESGAAEQAAQVGERFVQILTSRVRVVGLERQSRLPVPTTSDDVHVPVRWPAADQKDLWDGVTVLGAGLASGLVVIDPHRRDVGMFPGLHVECTVDNEGDPRWICVSESEGSYRVYRVTGIGQVEPLLESSDRPSILYARGEALVVATGKYLGVLAGEHDYRVSIPEPVLSACLSSDNSDLLALGRSGVLYRLSLRSRTVSAVIPPVKGVVGGSVMGVAGPYLVLGRRLAGGPGTVEVYKTEGDDLARCGFRLWKEDQPWAGPVFVEGAFYLLTLRGYLLGFRLPDGPAAELAPAGEAVRLARDRPEALFVRPVLCRAGGETILAAVQGNLTLFEPRTAQGTIHIRWQRPLSAPYTEVAHVVTLSSTRAVIVRRTPDSGAVLFELLSLEDGSRLASIQTGVAVVEALSDARGLYLLDVGGQLFLASPDEVTHGPQRWFALRRIKERVVAVVRSGAQGVIIGTPDGVVFRIGEEEHTLPVGGVSGRDRIAALRLPAPWFNVNDSDVVPAVIVHGPADTLQLAVFVGPEPSAWQLFTSLSISHGQHETNSQQDFTAGLLAAAVPGEERLIALARKGAQRVVFLRLQGGAGEGRMEQAAVLPVPGPIVGLFTPEPGPLLLAMRGLPVHRITQPSLNAEEIPDSPAIDSCVAAGAVLVCWTDRGAVWAYTPDQNGHLALLWQTITPRVEPPIVLQPVGARQNAVMIAARASGSCTTKVVDLLTGVGLARATLSGRPIAWWHTGDGVVVLSTDGCAFRLPLHEPTSGGDR